MPRDRYAAYVAIAFCGAVAFLDGADTQSFAIAAPVMARELSILPHRLSLIFSAGTLGIAAGAILCGPLADRMGPKTVLALSTLCFGVFQLATSYATGFYTLLLLRVFAGLGLGGAAPCFLALTAAHTRRERRPRVLSFLWSFFPLGALVGGIANGWIVENLGWREVFFIGGTIPIGLAVLLFFAAAEGPSAPTISPSVVRPRTAEAPIWWRDPSLRSRLLLLWCVFFAAFGSLAGIVVWMPSSLVHAGVSPAHGGLILSWNAAGALLSMAFAGTLLEWLGPRLLPMALLGGALVLLLTAFAIPSFAAVAAGMVALGVLFGFAASGSIAAAGVLLPVEGRSSGLGWSMGIGRMGQVILPLFMGMGIERHGASWVFAALAIVPAALAIAAWRFAVIESRAANRG